MRQPTILEQQDLEVVKLVPGGQGLATLARGKKIFLWNALPGERISKVEFTVDKAHYAEGIALDFIEKSPKRIRPKDPCYLSTSPWQIFNYNNELLEKAEILQETFRQHGLDVPQTEVETDGRDFYYRNKMEYALYYDLAEAKIFPAFRMRGSHRKIKVTQSSLERPEIFHQAQKVISDLNACGEEARKYQSLLLRCDQDGKVSGGLYENHRPHPQFPTLQDRILNQTFHYSPNGFFQINLPVYQMALREIQNWVKTDKLLDLYAGVGSIGLSLASDVRKLTLVECDRSAWQEMARNCEAVKLQNPNSAAEIQPVLAKSEEALDYIEADQTVVVDPPRAGCRPELLEKLLSTPVAQLIYLSCNPVTQARDLKILEPKYRILKVQPYNFFPRTPHLENLVILEPKPLN